MKAKLLVKTLLIILIWKIKVAAFNQIMTKKLSLKDF